MRTAAVLAIVALAQGLSTPLTAQLGQGPQTRRDSRWRFEQERADFLRDLHEEVAFARRHRSIAEIVLQPRRRALRGLVDLPGELPPHKDHQRFEARRHITRDQFVPPYLSLNLQRELLIPRREAKRGLVRLAGDVLPERQIPVPGSLYDELPLLLALIRESSVPRGRESRAYDELERPERPRGNRMAENKDVPDYCFSGAGHPLGGREWCYQHGYEVGGGWVREPGRNAPMERPLSPVDRASLAASIGADLTLELDAQRLRMGLGQPLTGSYIATLLDGAVLKVRSGLRQVAELSDRDRDGRADAIWRRIDR